LGADLGGARPRGSSGSERPDAMDQAAPLQFARASFMPLGLEAGQSSHSGAQPVVMRQVLEGGFQVRGGDATANTFCCPPRRPASGRTAPGGPPPGCRIPPARHRFGHLRAVNRSSRNQVRAWAWRSAISAPGIAPSRRLWPARPSERLQELRKESGRSVRKVTRPTGRRTPLHRRRTPRREPAATHAELRIVLAKEAQPLDRLRALLDLIEKKQGRGGGRRELVAWASALSRVRRRGQERNRARSL